MTSYKEVQYPACRLLCSEEEGFPLEWQGLVGEMKKIIQNETKLTLNSSKVHIQFKCAPSDEIFDEEFSTLSLEVVGPQMNMEPEYFYYDREAIMMKQFHIVQGAQKTVSDLKHLVTKLRAENIDEIGDKWEVVLETSGNKVEVVINFF